jgi:ATP-dependent RNA helicase DDX47/RRP3
MSKTEENTKENEELVETSEDEVADESLDEKEAQVDGVIDQVEQNNENNIDELTFESLGVVKELCEACEQLKWKHPTPIQREALPVSLKGRDIIGMSINLILILSI